MKGNLKKAVELLHKEKYTCVFYNGTEYITSRERGVKPLLSIAEQNKDMSGYVAADKITGKAAALLYALMNVKEVYSDVLSEHAKDIFEKYKITFYAKETTEAIINRDKTGFCPMETAVKDIDSPEKGLQAIKNTVKNLKKQ